MGSVVSDSFGWFAVLVVAIKHLRLVFIILF